MIFQLEVRTEDGLDRHLFEADDKLWTNFRNAVADAIAYVSKHSYPPQPWRQVSSNVARFIGDPRLNLFMKKQGFSRIYPDHHLSLKETFHPLDRHAPRAQTAPPERDISDRVADNLDQAGLKRGKDGTFRDQEQP